VENFLLGFKARRNGLVWLAQQHDLVLSGLVKGLMFEMTITNRSSPFLFSE